jgi:hypothetical protein
MPAANVLAEISGGLKAYFALAAVDFGSVLTQVSVTASITITGVLPGDYVLVFPTTALTTGMLVESTPARVTTADTVVVRATNASAGTIDQASQVMTFLVLRLQQPL